MLDVEEREQTTVDVRLAVRFVAVDESHGVTAEGVELVMRDARRFAQAAALDSPLTAVTRPVSSERPEEIQAGQDVGMPPRTTWTVAINEEDARTLIEVVPGVVAVTPGSLEVVFCACRTGQSRARVRGTLLGTCRALLASPASAAAGGSGTPPRD